MPARIERDEKLLSPEKLHTLVGIYVDVLNKASETEITVENEAGRLVSPVTETYAGLEIAEGYTGSEWNNHGC